MMKVPSHDLRKSSIIGNSIREDPIVYVNCDSNVDHACAIKELVRVKQELKTVRFKLGKLVCNVSDAGVGETGGYCLAVDSKTGKVDHVGDYPQYNVDEPLLQWMTSALASSEVVEFGCGVGHYGKVLQTSNQNIKWVGYDGAFNVEDLTNGFVQWMDLSRENWVGKKFDWVVCLEVGEHIPAQFEETVISNIVRHAKKGILLSWAVPGQGGLDHVNERPNDYIISKLENHGFRYNAEKTNQGRAASTFGYFKNTVMVFEK